MNIWVFPRVGKLSALFDEPAAFSCAHPRFEVKRSHHLIGFNRTGSVWLCWFRKLIERDLLGNPTRQVRFELPSSHKRLYWNVWQTHLERAPDRRFAVLCAAVGFQEMKLLRVDLEDLDVLLSPETLPASTSRNFSPDMTFFSWTIGLTTFRRRFDLATMTFVGDVETCPQTQQVSTEDSGDVVVVTQDKRLKLWRSTGSLEDYSANHGKLVCRGAPVDQLRSSVEVGSYEEALAYDHRMRPIVLASHSLATRCLSALANSETRDVVRPSLPDEECVALFDGFRTWYDETRSIRTP